MAYVPVVVQQCTDRNVHLAMRARSAYILCGPDDCMDSARCLAMDATDARVHVALGRLLVQQRRYDEARALYEEGSTATGRSRVSALWHVIQYQIPAAGVSTRFALSAADVRPLLQRMNGILP